MIIHQTLLNMFPPDSFDSRTITPFTANEFIQRILVPEVALRLIMEDRRLRGLVGAERALQVLRDSTAYGVAMFPEDSDESMVKKNNEDDGKFGAGVGVGDRIVMERARKRRKEIEEGGDGGIEDDMGFVVESGKESEGERKKQSKERGRCGTRSSQRSKGTASEVDERTLWSPRKGITRQKRRIGTGTNSDAIAVELTTDEDGTDSGMKTDGSLTCSRPKRNTKAVNYNDISSDDDDDSGKRKKKSISRQRQQSRSKSRTKPTSRSPVNDRPVPPVPLLEELDVEVKFGSRKFSFSDMEICSSDGDTRSVKGKSRIGGGSPRKKKLARTPSRQEDEEGVVDLDLNTPIPKRRGVVGRGGNAIADVDVDGDVDPTPRPVRKPDLASMSSGLLAQESVLARARARIQGDRCVIP